MPGLPCRAGETGEKTRCRRTEHRERSAGKKPTVCPVNATAKCLECHMPKVPMPTLHRDLTDHYIRVRDLGGRK